MCLYRNNMSKSTNQSGGFCLRDSEAVHRALQLLHIYCSNENSYSSAPESDKQNPLGRHLDLPFFFRYKHIISLKNLPSQAPSESCRTGFKETLRLCLFWITG